MSNNLEKKLEEMQSCVSLIENNNTTVDDAIAVYEKAVKLAGECYEILNNANGKIQELTKELETTIADLKEFE